MKATISLCEVLRSCVDHKQPPFLQRPVILFDLAVGLGLVETREDARDPTATSDTLTVCATVAHNQFQRYETEISTLSPA